MRSGLSVPDALRSHCRYSNFVGRPISVQTLAGLGHSNPFDPCGAINRNPSISISFSFASPPKIAWLSSSRQVPLPSFLKVYAAISPENPPPTTTRSNSPASTAPAGGLSQSPFQMEWAAFTTSCVFAVGAAVVADPPRAGPVGAEEGEGG